MPCFGSLLTAVETKTRLPHTIGLETATPSTGVFHATFSPAGAFHFTAVGLPSAVPAALAPRNAGQFCADSAAPAATRAMRRVMKRRMTISPPRGCRPAGIRALCQREAGDLVPLDLERDGDRRADRLERLLAGRDQREPLRRRRGGGPEREPRAGRRRSSARCRSAPL